MKAPKLTQKSEWKKSAAALAASNIRKELKAKWPGVKFSVRSDNYSMGSSVDVRWTNGPTVREVEAITGKYQYGHFDGMQDLYEYSKGFDDTYGEAKFVQTHREYTNEAIVEAAEDEGASYNMKEGYKGKMWVEIPDYHEYERTYRRLWETDFTKAPEAEKEAA